MAFMETIDWPGSERITVNEHAILLVDDEENILSALRRLLRPDRYQIFTATSGNEGLEILQRSRVDVVISDQRMPNMLGTVFLKHAKEVSPYSVRMILSGYTDLGSVTAAINEGSVYKFLTKPWDDDLLRLAIREAFNHKWIADENRMLQQMLVEVNEELAEANRRLANQVTFAENSLATTQALLHALPVAAFGVSGDGLLMLANELALRFFDPPLEICRSAAGQLPGALAEALPTTTEQDVAFDYAGQRWLARLQPLPQAGRGVIVVVLPGSGSNDGA
jgi:FixJ family two-component response regulator